MATTLRDQIDFLKTAAKDGVDAALKKHPNDISIGEAEGFKSLSSDQLDQLYAVNQQIAQVRTSQGGLEPDGTNNLC